MSDIVRMAHLRETNVQPTVPPWAVLEDVSSGVVGAAFDRNLPLFRRLLSQCRESDSGCIEWIGHTTQKGYGKLGDKGRTVRAHRVVFANVYGPIPEGLCVCHLCDNPKCVNPEHLFLGTNADNFFDSENKGRATLRGKGEENRHARFSDIQVRDIRTRTGRGERYAEIARDYHCHSSAISRIANRKRWAHLP